MRLTVDLVLPPEALADPDPEAWARGNVAALLRHAGYHVTVVRDPHPGDTAVDDEWHPDDGSWGLGPQAVAALAEAREAFTETEAHRLPCPWCGARYKPTGLGRHKASCHSGPGSRRWRVQWCPLLPAAELRVRRLYRRWRPTPPVLAAAPPVLAEPPPPERWVAAPIERRPFDPDAARRAAAANL